MESLFLQCKELIKQKIEYIGIIVCKDNDDWNTESVKLAKAECLILSQELEKTLRTVDPYDIKTVEYLFKDYRNTLI